MSELLILMLLAPFIIIGCYACYIWGYHQGALYVEKCLGELLKTSEEK